jgi:predicted secreted protein
VSDRQLSDPSRFLLRALVLLALMLALWWLVLLNPLLAGLRLSAELTLRLLPGGSSVSHVTIGPDRNWTFQVPAPAAVVNQERTQQMLGAAAAGSGRIKIRSLKVEGTARYPILFTVSLPLFWAILLAAPGRPRLLRMACGTAVLAIFALLSIAVYAVRLVGGYFQLTTEGFPGFLMDSAMYLAAGVVPYLAPVLVALSLDGELRGLILAGEAEPAAASAVSAAPRRRGNR